MSDVKGSMNQCSKSYADILREAAVILDKQPVPTRDEKRIGMIIQAHMPVDEMEKEASDKHD